MIASGVSSTIISTPVALSIAFIFRPSLPIILPFISSDSILKTDTQLSIASSVPNLWIEVITIFLASCLAESLASSIIFCDISRAWDLTSSFKILSNSSLASSAVYPEIFSICWTWSFLILSISLFFFSSDSVFFVKVEIFSSNSILSLSTFLDFCLISDSRFLRSCFFSLCSDSFESIYFSCSDFSSKNFSLAWKILLAFKFSASFLALLIIFWASLWLSLSNFLLDAFFNK